METKPAYVDILTICTFTFTETHTTGAWIVWWLCNNYWQRTNDNKMLVPNSTIEYYTVGLTQARASLCNSHLAQRSDNILVHP